MLNKHHALYAWDKKTGYPICEILIWFRFENVEEWI